MTLSVPVLILIIAVSVVFGRTRPVLTVAVLFTALGGLTLAGAFGRGAQDVLGFALRQLT